VVHIFHTALGPNQPSIQWVLWDVPAVVEQQEREADHSPPSSAEVKNGGAVPSLPHTPSWCGTFLGTGTTSPDFFTFAISILQLAEKYFTVSNLSSLASRRLFTQANLMFNIIVFSLPLSHSRRDQPSGEENDKSFGISGLTPQLCRWTKDTRDDLYCFMCLQVQFLIENVHSRRTSLFSHKTYKGLNFVS
jgi:hypothetical protein